MNIESISDSSLQESVKHLILLDHKKYTKKPTENIGSISNRLIKNPVEITIRELAKAVTYPNGKTFTPAYFKDNRDNDHWISQSVFALDIDNKDSKTKQKVDNPISFSQVLARLKDYSLHCAFAYTTFNHTEEWHRFRVVFHLNYTIVDKEERENIQGDLLKLFPEADSCPDAARMFFGGKDIIYEDYDNFLDTSLLSNASGIYSTRNSSDKNVNRGLKRANNSNKSEEKREKPIYNIGKSHLSSGSTNLLEHSNAKEYKVLEGIDFNKLGDRVKIFGDFLNPEIKLEHKHLVGLATSLTYIKGGSKLYKERIKANPRYSQIEKTRIITDCKVKGYKPAHLYKFSPYEADHEYTSLYHAARINRSSLIRLSKPKLMSLEDAEKKLVETIDLALNDHTNSIWIIKKATGLGGTTLLSKIKQPLVIAFPNHALKDEKNELFDDVTYTPKLPDNIPKKDRDKIEYYYSIGAYKDAYRYIRDRRKKNLKLARYLSAMLDSLKSEGTILTTHSRALFAEFDNHNTIVFDEDPLQNILEMGYLKLEDLNTLIGLVHNENDKEILQKCLKLITDRINCVESTIDNLLFKDLESIEDAVLDYQPRGKNKHPFSSGILKFFHSDYYAFHKDSDENSLSFLKHNSLNSGELKNKKIIIMSATVDELIYRKLYGDRVKFIDISDVETKGFIYQDTSPTASRRSLSEKSVMEKINNRIKKLPVITFMLFKKYFYNPIEEIHIGKSTGFDSYKGKNIAVVATPHLKIIDYLLYAKALGTEITQQDFEIEQQIVKYRDIEFVFSTFSNPELQLLQLYLIESELIQAVGRARILRYDCFVYLISALPLHTALVTEEEKQLYIDRVNQAINQSDYLEE